MFLDLYTSNNRPHHIDIIRTLAERAPDGGQLSELIGYAKSIGMREDWIQKRRTAYVHFDLTGSRLARVTRIGAKQMAGMVMGERKERRLERNSGVHRGAGPDSRLVWRS